MKLTEILDASAAPVWDKMSEHPFMQGIRTGTLPAENYGYYLSQNYPYLFHYARALSAACGKAGDIAILKKLCWMLDQVVNNELTLNYNNAVSMGFDGAKLEYTDMSPEIFGYANFLYRMVNTGDLLDCMAALYPCPVSYAYIAGKLISQGADGGMEHHQYGPWLRYYNTRESNEFKSVMGGIIDSLGDSLTEARIEELKTTVTEAAKYDYLCLDMGWKKLRWAI